MIMKTRIVIQWILLASLLGAAGCSIVPEPQADPTHYYVLTSAASPAVTPDGAGLKLGLKKIKLPPYLQKGSMVVRHAGNELAYHDVARWAEPLADSIEQLVQARLLANPRVTRVFTEGFPFDLERDYDVAVTINRCEGVRQNGETIARVAATIEITAPTADGKLVTRRAFGPVDTPWDGRDYSALAAALSAAVDSLGDEIIAALPAK